MTGDSSAAEHRVAIGYDTIEKERKAGWVSRQFDAVAGRYDLMNTLLSAGIHYLWKRTAMDMLRPGPGEAVLDLCGGTGDLAVAAVRRVGPAGRVVLCDINHRMMAAGRATSVWARWRRRIRYVQGNAERLPFPDASFDGAIVGFGIRNLTDMPAGLSEMYRVLRPGGRLVCLEFSHPAWPWFRRLYDAYSFHVMPRLGALITGSRRAYTYLPESIRVFPDPPELARLFRVAGFRDVTYRRLTNGIAAIHRGRKPA